MEHRHQQLAAGGLVPCSGTSVPGNGPGTQVAVAGIPDQPGLVNVLAGDVEPQNGDRQVAAGSVDALQFVAPDDLAAADAVCVGQDDVDRLDGWIGIEEGQRLIDRRPRGRRHEPSSEQTSPKAATSRSTCSVVVPAK